MKRRSMIAAIMGLLLSTAAACLLVVMAMAGWLFFMPNEEAGVITRITILGPLAEPITPEVNQSSPEPGAGNQPSTGDTSTLTGPEMAEAFTPPPGTANSVTLEGAATKLVIPKLNLDAPVAIAPLRNQSWDVEGLGQSVGHLEGTASPGGDSNMVLAGHVTLTAGVFGPFAGLGQLTPGDLVIVYEGNEKYHYIIDSHQIVDDTAVEVTNPSDVGQLTLITCANWDQEAGEYSQRLIVKGHLISG